jgi:hypothetical protein
MPSSTAAELAKFSLNANHEPVIDRIVSFYEKGIMLSDEILYRPMKQLIRNQPVHS